MNNRSPFIPNIPTPQGHWGDPQIYNPNSNSNTTTNQSNNGQIPFTAHQQMQFQTQSQPMYNIGYTTSAPSMPTLNQLQANSTIFTEAWGAPTMVNSGMQMNYSFQQVNPYQQQQITNAQAQMMQNIVNVNQSPRAVQLTLDTPHFVHFPVNLSPTSGLSLPLASLNSRGSTTVAQFTNRPNISNNSLNSRSPTSSQFSVSPSSSPGVALSLDSRMESVYTNSSNQSPALSSRSGSGNSLPSSHNPPYLNMPSLFDCTASRVSGSSVQYSNPSPPNSVQRPMSPFSGSSSPSPTLQGGRSGNNRLTPTPTYPNTSSVPLPYNQSSPGRMTHMPQPQNSPSPSTMIPGFANLRSHAPIAHSMARSQAPNPAAYVPQPPQSQSPRPRAQKSPSPRSRGSNQAQNMVQQVQMANNLPPSPPPVKEKKPRAPRKPRVKKEPQKPVPVNPVATSRSGTSSLPTNLPMSSLMSSVGPTWPSYMFPSPGLPVTAHLSSHVNSLTDIRSSVRPGSNLNNFPMPRATPSSSPAHSVIRSSVIQTSPQHQNQNHNQPPSPQKTYTTLTRPVGTSTSPPRATNTAYLSPQRGSSVSPTKFVGGAISNRPSVLDYALEKAGIHLEMGNVEIFPESEILALVGHVPDQSHDLKMLNPNYDSQESKPHGYDAMSSWEREACSRVLGAQGGDIDLDAELGRFYNPPSPLAKNTDVQGTSMSTSTTIPEPVDCKPSITLVQAQASISSAQTQKQPTTKQKPKGPVHDLSDDDDCEVILVKLNDKRKRKAPQAGRGRGVPLPVAPKKMTGAGRGRGAPPQSQGPQDRALNSKGVDPRAKAVARPAYPNGRFVEVAPKTTVPIPQRTYPAKSGQIQVKPQNTKGTARKSTAGILYTPLSTTGPKTGIAILRTNDKRSANLPKVVAPSPPRTQRSSQNIPAPAIISTISNQRPKRHVSEIDRFYVEPSTKMTRQATKALQQQNIIPDKNLQIRVERIPEKRNPVPPPIKIKVNLKEGSVKSSFGAEVQPTNTSFSRPGPRSKMRSESPKTRAQSRAPDSIASDTDSLIVTSVGLGSKSKSVGSDDDLLVVGEYLADSDESFDLEGERDEASSDTETEDEDDEELEEIKASQKEKVVERKVTPPTAPMDQENPEKPSSGTEEKPVDAEETTKVISGDSDLTKPTAEADVDDDMKPPDEIEAKVDNEISSSESEDELEEVQEVPKVFQMPKPKVIIKGTKEDADKAVSEMRQALAQLTKFKLPFFGR